LHCVSKAQWVIKENFNDPWLFLKDYLMFRFLTHTDVFIAGYKPAFFVSESWLIAINHCSESQQLKLLKIVHCQFSAFLPTSASVTMVSISHLIIQNISG
jgi:hypothetical protein